jgi:hypothetical protein
MWSPKGQQVMIPTPDQPKKQYGIGAVKYHTGETVVLVAAALDFFERYNQESERILSLIGSHS